MDKIEFWDCDWEKEILSHRELDEAIESYLEDPIPGKPYPEIIEVFGYARREVNADKFKKCILEYAYDHLSEEYDGEDGHDQTKVIEDAAATFVKVYLENYTSWGCVLVKTEKVNTREWIIKNRPEFLEEIQIENAL